MPSSRTNLTRHHEDLAKSLDDLFDAQRKLPDAEDEKAMRLIIRKPWVTSVAEFILLRDLVESMTQHAEQISKEYAAMVDALREMASAASAEAPELDAVARAHGKTAMAARKTSPTAK
jgi:hypothetical protein